MSVAKASWGSSGERDEFEYNEGDGGGFELDLEGGCVATDIDRSALNEEIDLRDGFIGVNPEWG
jgi:hypothetical protein